MAVESVGDEVWEEVGAELEVGKEEGGGGRDEEGDDEVEDEDEEVEVVLVDEPFEHASKHPRAMFIA